MAYIRKIENNTEIDRLLNETCVLAARSGYVEIGDDNFCLPVYYEDYAEAITKFRIRDDDVFLCGHPKTGTTWAIEMVWLIVNNFDYDTALKLDHKERSFLLEAPVYYNWNIFRKNRLASVPSILQLYEQMKSPRLFKTHLHWSLLPEEIRNGFKLPKIIVTLRNAEDTCVSMFYMYQTLDGYKGTFEDFCELFLNGRVFCGPFWKQVLSFWNERHRSNILFITYKDMKNDLGSVIRKVAAFLEKDINEEQVRKLMEHLSFESMKNNPAVNKSQDLKLVGEMNKSTFHNDFLRTGKVDGYKSKMSPEMIARFEAWTNESTKDTDLTLY